MKFVVIGLGSMGKRRIRCLKALGYHYIYGYDIRDDRRHEVERDYSIKTFSDLNELIEATNPDAFIISVPPDIHHEFIRLAIKQNRHFFVEASVLDMGMEEFMKDCSQRSIIAAPSATLLYHPAIGMIKDILDKEELGVLSNIIVHSGQFLPDWHKYEPVSDFYVSNPATGGAREIVPFELGWITHILGFPHRVCGNYRKTIDIPGAEKIEDTYNCLLDYGNFLGVLTVDVVSRYATRRLVINGDKKQLIWDWNYNAIQLFNPIEEKWEERSYKMDSAANGYNANIGENMYIEEIRNFIDAINRKRDFVNNLEKDYRVLQLLYAIEESDKTSQYVRIRS
ncbi:MAG: Gfo/Idh/MocA family oxidoreductase [Dehalococcoidales bacterium]|nr:Gfo/Idh/MocA family oxidoreductase [Dehalococcoidales bacterium]